MEALVDSGGGSALLLQEGLDGSIARTLVSFCSSSRMEPVPICQSIFAAADSTESLTRLKGYRMALLLPSFFGSPGTARRFNTCLCTLSGPL